MTNYNDGNWHGWKGGDCPVHPKSVVEYVTIEPTEIKEDKDKAGLLYWIAGTDIVAFRVTKEYKQPREYWVKNDCKKVLTFRDTDDNETYTQHGYIHVKEVE